ncbi:MAG: phosphodiesterase [Acidimicrobiales bacterium]|nr:phosphodiesterase [Acidimicrobiales bacterium]
MLIAQISDLHVAEDHEYMRGFVDANAKLELAVRYLNTMEQRPDVVIATGDLTDHGRPEQYALLAEILAASEIPVLLVPGNHDEREPFRSFARSSGHSYVPAEGPICYTIDDHEVRLVALDSLRLDHHDGEVDSERLAWLNATLAAAPNTPTLVFLHHPPFTTGIWWMDCIGLTGAAELEALIRRHPQVVRVVSGHLHRPIETAWGHCIVSCAPSTTHQTQCNLHPEHEPVVAAEPPQLQLHWWTGSSFVSHTTVFEPPTQHLNIASLVSDWPSAKARIKQGPPFAKGPGGPF